MSDERKSKILSLLESEGVSDQTVDIVMSYISDLEIHLRVTGDALNKCNQVASDLVYEFDLGNIGDPVSDVFAREFRRLKALAGESKNARQSED